MSTIIEKIKIKNRKILNKNRVSDVGFKPFTYQREPLGFEFLPNCWSVGQGGVYGMTLYQLFLPSDEYFCCLPHIGITHLYFRGFLHWKLLHM